MAGTMKLDMYEGNPAKRRDYRGYEAGVYGRRDGAARKEPVYEGRKNDRYEPGVRRKRQNTGRKSCRKKKTRRRILTGIILYFILAGIIATCWMMFNVFAGSREKVHAEGIEMDGADVTEAESDALEEEAYDKNDNGAALNVTPEIRQECQEMYARQESLLLLVNKEHELPASYQPILHSICKGRLEAADILYEDLCAMLEAGGDAGYQYWIASAHRDRDYQQKLVNEDVEKYMSKGYSYEAALQKTYEYTMPAGYSEHETGLALDILCSTNTIMDESQEGEPGNRWLVEHCHEYGFILRYPADKEDVTGISYEPWHFRYVGKEAAAYLHEKGWTLEEFYEVVNGGI